MSIEFRCTRCQTLLRTPDDTVGRSAVCPKCSLQMDVPYISCPADRSPDVAPLYEDEPEPAPSVPPLTSADNMAIASLLLGIGSMFGSALSCCCLLGPLAAFPMAIVGLILGILGLRSNQRGFAIAGIVLCSLGLLAAVVAGVVMVIAVASSQMQQGMP